MSEQKPGPPLFWTGVEDRAAKRCRLVGRTALTTWKTGALAVLLKDLTELGCRLSLAERITVGSNVKIALTSSIEVTGWVVWSINGHIGVEFASPMSANAFAIVKRQYLAKPQETSAFEL